MIYDKLCNISLYKGICPNLDTAIDFLCRYKVDQLPLGRMDVDGDNVFINIMEASAAPAEEKGFEIHKNYMDIQIDIMGTEIIEIGDESAMHVADYNPETDFGNVECPTLVSCTMGKGNFIICMTEEPHKPGIAVGEDRFLKKCVIKVHI